MNMVLLSTTYDFLCKFVLIMTVVSARANSVSVQAVKFPSTVAEGFHWVLAPPGESHVSACTGNMLTPTSPLQDIPWSEEVMRAVVAGLGLSVVSASSGMVGCCAPGLWCHTGGCYTQSLQDKFVNVGLSQNLNRSTVYTCEEYSFDQVVSAFLSFEDGAVALSGANYGLDRDALRVTMNGDQCADVDLCHTVCQSCHSNSCPTGSVCLSMNSFRGCFPYCSGGSDTSCPCSTTCQQVNVAISQSSYISTHLCAPPHLDCRHYVPPSGSHLQCHTPSIYSQIYDDHIWSNTAQDVTVTVHTDAVAIREEIAVLQCSQDSDCFDMDAYTTDSCNDEGVCVYSQNVEGSDEVGGDEGTGLVPAHGSTLSHVRDRSTPFTYAWFQLSGQNASQLAFQAEVVERGVESKAGSVDDYPVDFLDLDFTFNYFGNSVTEVTVNPNGVISFPPFSHCWGMITGLGCPVYRTSTNIISVWGRDWDPSMNGKEKPSTVFTYKQQRENGTSFNSSSLGGINANAFHVMYSDIHIYDSDQEVRNDPTNPNSFSASIYEDGSVRLRYHNSTVAFESVDIFGLWGSRAATPASPLLSYESSSTRYHQETFNASELLQDGHDMVFCGWNTVACMSNTCTRAGRNATFTLFGEEPSCLAAVGGMTVQCVWGGGMASTQPTFLRDEGTNLTRTIVSCPTPTLHLHNNSLVSLDLRLAVDQSLATSPMGSGQKSIFTKRFDSATGEVVNNHLMVRYFSAQGETADEEVTCGCDALLSTSVDSQCDSCLLCSNSSETQDNSDAAHMLDCHGDCMGSAYVDTCGTCAGGNTGKRPVSSCDISAVEGDDMSTISKTILFLTMMICITFMFTACLRIVRMSLSAEELEERARVAGGAIALQDPHRAAPLRRGNGLSRFEIDALGEDEFGLIKIMGDEESAESVYGPRSTVPNIECAICLNDFLNSSQCRQLPCDHVFHKSCIDEWFILSVKCPMCKRNIRELILGEEELPQRRASEGVNSLEGQLSGTSRGDVGEDRSDNESDTSGGVENPLIRAVEMSPVQRNV